MKYVAIVKAFDKELCEQWHSGSCTSYQTKLDCNTNEEGEAFCRETISEKYNDMNRYTITTLVLGYEEKDSASVEDMFKYM